MDRPASASRRRTLDLPSKPEAGLAEWTSKIKALQRQVDEDEETEHRRLEEEIQASRLARIRRSAGYSRAGSVDLSDSELVDTRKITEPNASGTSTLDKQQHQETALRKLMGERGVYVPQPASRNGAVAPVSLATFIGGRATGPRLTKHAPQQDAHDPTQFEQRTHITSPHPIFGRGGVAMPGMTDKSNAYASAETTRQERDSPAVSTPETGRDRTSSTSPVVKALVQKAEETVPVSQKTDVSYSSRQRTVSTPTGTAPLKPVPLNQPQVHADKPVGEAYSRPTSLSPALRSSTQGQDRHSFTTNLHSPSPPSPISRSYTSSQNRPPPSPTPSSSSKASITTPSLARPIQPSPRLSLGPQVPLSPNPSPAFLRPPPPKDPTPSISRLQGRGFVRSIVQASSQLTTESPRTPPLPEKKNSGGRKSVPVLERWQGGAASAPTSPPIISPKPVAMRKSRTVDPSSEAFEFTPPKIKVDHTGRSLRSMASLPSIHHTGRMSSSGSDAGREGRSTTPGLGSSTTMISYIKPIKTGDRPSTASPPSRSLAGSPGVDELGVRVRARSKSREAVRAQATGGSTGLPTTGKPLSHLTKDRAKKPRKARATLDTVKEPPAKTNLRFAVSGDTRLDETSQSPLTNLISTARVPEVVVAFPSSDTSHIVGDTPLSTKPSWPPKDKFDDDFAPEVVQEKPPRLTDIIVPVPSVTSEDVDQGHLVEPAPVSPAISKEKPSKSPVRHARIPSTGNRATVMDVAQVFHEQVVQSPGNTSASATDGDTREQPTSAPEDGLSNEDEIRRPPVKSLVANWGPKNGTIMPDALVDKRKSSYERYSSIMMPPLEEEKTPASSPAGSISRTAFPPSSLEISNAHTDEADSRGPTKEPFITSSAAQEPSPVVASNLIHIDFLDEPLPELDIAALLRAERAMAKLDTDVQTISVDVLSVIGNTANAIPRDAHIFYDTELLAVIHRVKARSTGLVSTTVWAWRGKRCTAGEREERKLQELARRYGTSLTAVHQYCEPEDFVTVLGGQLVTRQGTRAHWSAENTAMHLVRSIGGSTFIDEVELSIRNLCSGFSYCLSLIGSFYVWYGCGSVESERLAAVTYAKSLASSASAVVELVEGETDNDEMFWMILGEGDYAKADYWKWRSGATDLRPRIWSVDAEMGCNAVTPVPSFANYSFVNDLVHMVDCVWEFFVLVGNEARGKRRDIKLALSAAVKMSQLTASERPFAPTVHVLILPSQVPADLRLNFRDIDEVDWNDGFVPDHMNLISASEAEEHIMRTTWEKTAVQDSSMLPLGIHKSDLE